MMTKSVRTAALAAILMGGTLLGGTLARANSVNLSIDHCTGGCFSGTSPFGTVTYTQDGTNVDVTVHLLDGYVFQNSTGFDAFGFNLPGVQTITNLTSGFAYDPNGYKADGFGSFTDGITASATGGQNLSFTIQSTSIGQFGFSTNPPGDTSVLFASDISAPNGNTGNVGGGISPVPAPIAGVGLPGFIMGLLGMYALARRRKKPVPQEHDDFDPRMLAVA